MLQRYVYTALSAGLSAFAADHTLYQSLFGDLWGLSAGEVTIITNYFTANPPIVSHAYKQPQAKFPQYVIMTMSEQQPLFALSDFGGGALGVTPAGTMGQLSGSFSSMWTHNVQIVSQAAKLPEVAYYMHEVAKYILVSAKNYFQQNHLDLVALSGSEFSQAPQAMDTGDFIFQRAITFRTQREFKVVDKNSSLGRVFSVTGLERPTALAAADELQLVTATGDIHG